MYDVQITINKQLTNAVNGEQRVSQHLNLKRVTLSTYHKCMLFPYKEVVNLENF
jgi:hypothetical protein